MKVNLKQIIKQLILEEIYSGKFHTIGSKNNDHDLTEIDNWKITDADFLNDMGFENGGMYHFVMKNPDISVCHSKKEGFIVNDKSKNEKNTFRKFQELEDYFTKYQQKWQRTPYL